MAKQRSKKTTSATATSAAPAEPAVEAAAVPAKVSAPAKTSAPAKGDFVMKSGQLMVGRGEVRKPGDVVKRDELTDEEAEKFLARGTIGIRGA